MSFEINVKSLRKSKDLTQEQLARALNCSQKTISAWEKGRTKPKFKQLMKLQKYFDVNMKDLIRNEMK